MLRLSDLAASHRFRHIDVGHLDDDQLDDDHLDDGQIVTQRRA